MLIHDMLRILKQYFPIRNIVFFGVETCVIFATMVLSTIYLTFLASNVSTPGILLKIALITTVCQLCLYYNDLYDFQLIPRIRDIIIRILQSLGMTSLILACIYFLFPITALNQTIYLTSVIFLILFMVCWRIVYIEILNLGLFNEHILLLGSSELAMEIYSAIDQSVDCGYSVSIVVPEDTNERPANIPRNKCVPLGSTPLAKLAREKGLKKIVVSTQSKTENFPVSDLIDCRTQGIEVIEGSAFYSMLTGKVLVRKIDPEWLIFSQGFQKSRIKSFFKRLQDIVISSVMLMVCSPLLVIVAVLIKLDSKGPIFFLQDRVGRYKKEYMVRKFRSMVEDAEKKTGPVWATEEDSRITRMGKFIRKYRIDELPQLWQVLTGTMSLVGPRPERKHFTDQLEKTIPFYSQRFNVKPGLTGWAQVCYDYGASEEDAEEKLNYDLFYIQNMSFAMDTLIILKTVKTVLFGKGAR